MAMAVPVVATSVGGPAEIVRDGVDGYVLPPREPERWARTVAELLADPECRATLGRAGHQRARAEFAPSAHAERVGAIYRDVLERNAPRRRRWP
jgi:glycosyltransferase involved in cell wall biosynthesis